MRRILGITAASGAVAAITVISADPAPAYDLLRSRLQTSASGTNVLDLWAKWGLVQAPSPGASLFATRHRGPSARKPLQISLTGISTLF